jgi:hypothetical protein
MLHGEQAASILLDGNSAGELEAGGFLKLPAVAGEHFIIAQRKEVECKWEKKVRIPAGMQVAEIVDFKTACPLNPDSGSIAPGPSDVVPQTGVDPKIREAKETHERGCRLHFLQLDSEAVPLLEKAANLVPGMDNLCLAAARGRLTAAQRLLATCKSPFECSAAKNVITLGNYLQGFQTVDSAIQNGEHGQFIRGAASIEYVDRALRFYAMGNRMAALRDLETALAWERREPSIGSGIIGLDNTEVDIHFYRAVMLDDMGNYDGASQDCRIVLSSNSLGGQYALFWVPQRNFCTHIVAILPAPNEGQRRNASNVPGDSHLVDDAIGRIQGGQYSPMPQAQVSGGSGSGSPRLTIENGTQYDIQVYLSGPETRSVPVPAGGTSVLDLPAGSFKLAAEIPNSSIMPFYGEQNFNNGNAYIEKFYIQRVQ